MTEESKTQQEEYAELRKKWLKDPSKKLGWKKGDPKSEKYIKEEQLMCVQCGYTWIKMSEEQVRCSNCYPNIQEMHEGG